jgi:hypothetical protein
MANYKWVTDLAKQFESGAKYTPYTGEMVAGLTPTQMAGIQNVNSAQGMAQPYYEAGAQYAQAGAQGRTPEFTTGLVNKYMSPYIQDVANTTFGNLSEMNAQQQQQVLGSAIGRGAYGGDRAGIAQAELARQQGLSTGAAMANVYNTGYGQALGQLNQNTSQQQADAVRQLQAAQMLGTLGSGAQSAALEGAKAQISAGSTQQAVAQAQDVANQQQFMAAQQFPYQNLSWLASLLTGVGSQMGGTSTTTQPGPSVGSQILGGIMALSQIPWSDERLKHDINEVGKTHDGQPIYTFKYNGDNTTHMGLMAQDVEKKHPEAVVQDGAYKRVNYDAATKNARVHKDYGGGLVSSEGGVVSGLHEREGYAFAGAIPYSTQPNYSTPLTLADVGLVPQNAEMKQLGSTLPRYPKPYEDTATKDIIKGLQGMTPQQKAVMAANINKVKGVLGVDSKDGVAQPTSAAKEANAPTGVSPDNVANATPQSRSLLNLLTGGLIGAANGGVINRHGYGNGGPPEQPAGLVPDSGQTLGEKIFGYQISPEARMGIMAAGLGMMAGRSPFMGVNIGEGALGGLNTYYNTLKNERDLALEEEKNRISELNASANQTSAGAAQTTAKTGSEKQVYEQAKNALDVAVQRRELLGIKLKTLNGTDYDVSQDPQYKILDRLVTQAQQRLLSMGGIQEQNTGGVVRQKFQQAGVVSHPAPPAPTAEDDLYTGNEWLAPGYDDPAFIKQLRADKNPQLLRLNAQSYSLAKLPDLAKQAEEQANAVEAEMKQLGYGYGKQGKIPVPNFGKSSTFAENEKALASTASGFTDMQKKDEIARSQLGQVEEAAKYYIPSVFGPAKANIQAILSGLDYAPNDEQLQSMENYGLWQKNALKNIFSTVSEQKGPAKVVEFQGAEKQFPMPGAFDAVTAEKLVGQMRGEMNWRTQYMKDFQTAYAKNSNLDENKFFEKWSKRNPIDDYVKKARMDTAFGGAAPLDANGQPIVAKLIPGKSYILPAKNKDTGKVEPMKFKYKGIIGKDDDTGIVGPQFDIVK